MPNPTAFISYSHSDRASALELGKRLRENGVDAWVDEWEIKAGDSLVQKIFNQGLANCAAFVVLLSPNSVDSKWVQTELDQAVVQRIAGLSRVIPVVLQRCDIPVPLLPLKRLDAEAGWEKVTEGILDAVFDVEKKPPLGSFEDATAERANAIAGLSVAASKVARLLVELTSEKQLESGREISVSAKTIAERTSLDPQEINDAVEELDEYGLAERRRQLGTKPYSFAFVNPTYVLPLKLGQAEVGYDPEAHVKALATLVRERQRVGGPEAAEALHLKPLEVNRAASYLIDNDIVDAFMTMGTAPFSFRALRATRKTREFVDKECV